MKLIRQIILITGTPGVGKTTISQKLASFLNARYINLTEIIKQKNLDTFIDSNRETLVVDTENVSKIIQETLDKTEGIIIIEGHFVVFVVPKNEVDIVLVLRRDPRELKDVLLKRGYNDKKLWENITAELLDICLVDALSSSDISKVCELDVSGKSIESVVEEVIFILNNRKECKYGEVDWLGKLESEGQLEEYLTKID